MSNRSAYRLLIGIVIVAVLYELLLSFGPGVDQPFAGMWMVWHPYYLPVLGLATTPFVIGYTLPLVKRLGGRDTALGGTLWYMSMGMLSYAVLGTMLIFFTITCPKWNVFTTCHHPLGYLPYPHWGYAGFGLVYPLVIVGIIRLLHVLGVGMRDVMREWWIIVLVFALQLFVTMPFGLGLSFGTATLSSAHALDLYIVLGGASILALTAVAARHARELAGGMFARPVAVLLVGFACFDIGDLISTHTNVSGRMWEASDPSSAPYTVAFVVWIIGFLMIGSIVERMLSPATSSERPAAAPDPANT